MKNKEVLKNGVIDDQKLELPKKRKNPEGYSDKNGGNGANETNGKMDYETVVEAIAECAMIASTKKAIIPRSIANKSNRAIIK